ncbi:MAG: type II toxin-antitoxin system RelE/ParE family toxin [Oscillospiraceae bacterium]|nr:type II toxin-antitoxin system RelE/ParE family toxin [Oscillospiraceae bacterium]
MSEKYEVTITPEAHSDILNIYSYVAVTLKEPRIADKLTARIYKAAYSLDFSSERHPVVDWEPWHSRNIRKFPVGKYMVYYGVDRKLFKVQIVRIFHGGRNVEEIISSENDD